MLVAHQTLRRVWFLECREQYQIVGLGAMVRGHDDEDAPAAYRQLELMQPSLVLSDLEVPFGDDTNISVYPGTVFRGPLLCIMHEPVRFPVFVRNHRVVKQPRVRQAQRRTALGAIEQVLLEHPWLSREDLEEVKRWRPRARLHRDVGDGGSDGAESEGSGSSEHSWQCRGAG